MTGRKRNYKQFLDPAYDQRNNKVTRRTDEFWRAQIQLADVQNAAIPNTTQGHQFRNISTNSSPDEDQNPDDYYTTSREVATEYDYDARLETRASEDDVDEDSNDIDEFAIINGDSNEDEVVNSDEDEDAEVVHSGNDEDEVVNRSDSNEDEVVVNSNEDEVVDDSNEDEVVVNSNEDEVVDDSNEEEVVNSSDSDEDEINDNPDIDFENFPENHRPHNERRDWNNRIMFEASSLKVSDVLFLIEVFTSRFLISDTGKIALLELINILAGPEFQNARATSNFLFKSFDSSTDLVSYVFYCDICNEKLIQPVNKNNIPKGTQTCHLCEKRYSLTTDSSNSFIVIDVEHQLRLLLENKGNQKLLLENVERINEKKLINDYVIEDVYDGSLYRETVPTEPGVINLTYNGNGDGASIFNTSKKSLWPFQIVINELPPTVRFKNIIVSALWITSTEPKPPVMNLFLSECLEKSRHLREHGITVTKYDTGEDIVFKLNPICLCVDSVARPIMQNRLQYNGYFSCSWCYIRGIHSGGIVRYSIEENPVLRLHDSHLDDVRNAALTQRNINGVKGPCILSTIQNFDCVWGFPMDYLHGMLLGVGRQLWNLWTSPGTAYYLTKEERNSINKRMAEIKPPLYVHRLLRLLTEKCKWRASEWRSWILFYSIPCLIGILNDACFKSYILFVRSIFVLLKTKITEIELEQCEVDLIQFVGECQIMYGLNEMTFNLHSVLHLTECVRRTGPLWATSTFPFESFIYNLKQKVKGPKGVLQQMSRKVLKDTQIRNGPSALCDSAVCIDYCEKIINHRHLNTQYELTEDGVIFIGRQDFMRDVRTVYGIDVNMEINVGRLFDRCIYKQTPLRSTAYTRPKRNNDTVCQLHTGAVVEITRFLYYNDITYILAQQYTVSTFRHDGIEVRHMLRAIQKQDEVKAYLIRDVKYKLVVIQTPSQMYFSKPPNTLEIQ